jgi:two-component system, NtrC family, response regulator GlrR
MPIEKTSANKKPGTQFVEKPTRNKLRVRKARLEVIRGPDLGKKRNIQSLHLVVGASPDCDLVLSDPTISWQHFELLTTEDGCMLRDLDSKNGTDIRGIRVKQAVLYGGEQIDIGNSTLLLSVSDEHEEFKLSRKNSFGSMIGRSATIRQVFAELEHVAPSDAFLLLEGESGTGKDLAAENIHRFSPRKDKPFVVFDCGAVSSTLIESELFGHRKGAFTGADRDRPGVIESADGGTIFLNEIGEIPLKLQPRLLRLLDTWETRRVGENQYRKVDVRLIAATNRDLKNEVELNQFREDLYYRLTVVRIRLPALRDRREDIALLAKKFIADRAPDQDPDKIITDQVLAMFLNHLWPGNIRELRNVVDRLILFPKRPKSALSRDEEASKLSVIPADFLDLSFRDFRDQCERTYLSAVIDSCKGSMTEAAAKADLPRMTFYRLVKKHKLGK